MTTNVDQEREEIRFGFEAVTDASVRPLRACLIALANGHPMPPDAVAKLVTLENEALDLRVRNAVLTGSAIPLRPSWLDPAPGAQNT